MRGRGPPPGARYCDFKTLISFLQLFRKAPLTVYRLYHESGRGWDLKKIYRYLRYSADLKLLEIDHVEKMPGPLPAKWWRLTQRGQDSA
ncbi:MAG: hypothetical protein OEW62_02915 [Candidatus Bathyarchaeota archaeon]|nr:hypothetical protein [Candidatus Bathyarchaeota archaeon]